MAISELTIMLTAKDMATGILSKFADTTSQKFKGLGAAMPMIVGGIVAVGAAVGGSLKKFADFEKGMREVNTMMQLGEEEFQNFSGEVRDLATNMGLNVSDLVSALYQAISAGIPKENALTFMEVAAKAAIGGVTDTTTAVDGLTTVINAFGMDVKQASKVADLMFTTVKGGKTTFEELSASMYNVAPLAASLGVEFDEVSASLATLTQQGVPTAQATTQLRGAMTALIKPTNEMTEMINSLGYESGETMIRQIGLIGTFNELYNAAEGNKEMLGDLFGRVEGLNAVLGLTGPNADAATESLNNMKEASEGAGASTEAFNEMNKTAARRMEELKAAMNELFLTVGEAIMPMLKSIVETLIPIVKTIGEWINANPKLVSTLTKVGLALVAIIATLKLVAIAKAVVLALSGPVGWGILAAVGIGMGAMLGELGIGPFAMLKKTPYEEGKKRVVTPEGSYWLTADQYRKYKETGELPMFQHGGIVPGPIGKPVPIIAHGGEQFLGPNKMMPSVNIYVEGFVGSERLLAETVREELQRVKIRNVSTGL
ncbi:MAG: phage tail tape measure protein [Candidatus Odinarchaeota archaeon]